MPSAARGQPRPQLWKRTVRGGVLGKPGRAARPQKGSNQSRSRFLTRQDGQPRRGCGGCAPPPATRGHADRRPRPAERENYAARRGKGKGRPAGVKNKQCSHHRTRRLYKQPLAMKNNRDRGQRGEGQVLSEKAAS